MPSDVLPSLAAGFGRERVRFDHDDADRFPWLFEPYRAAGLDLRIERGTIRTIDGSLDMELCSDVIDLHRDGVRLAAFQRVIRGDTAWHKSSLTFEGHQRQGVARRVLAASVALYDTIGVERVRLNAVGAGRYVWARAGFDFDERLAGGDPPAIPRLVSLAERLGHELDPQSAPWEIAGRRDEVPPGLFEARGGRLRFLGSPADAEGPLGRVLFLCAGVGDWDGTLELRPGTPGRAQFEAYCGPAG